MESDRIDLGLARLRLRLRRNKKVTIPITANTAIPPMTPPTIAGVFDFVGDDDSFVVTVPLGFILSTGALREES